MFITGYDEIDIVEDNIYESANEDLFQLMTESINFQDDMTLQLLHADYLELKAIKESASESEIERIEESVLTDAIKKIKEFFIKIGTKIKNFVYTWVARIYAKFCRSNKAFFNKYKNTVKKKDDFEVLYRKTNKLDKWVKFDANKCLNTLKDEFKVEDESAELAEDFDRDDVRDKALAAYCGYDVKFDSCKKDMEEQAWDGDKDTVHFSSIKIEVEELLQDGDKQLERFKKNASDAEKKCKDESKRINSDKNNNKAITRMSSVASIFGAVITKAAAASTSIYKEQLSQARTVYAKAIRQKDMY